MGNSGQAPCPARQTRTGREQPRRRPLEEGNQGLSKAARYHRPKLRPYRQPSSRPFQRRNLPLPRGNVWQVLQGTQAQQQSKQEPPHHQATTFPRIKHGSRRSIGLSIPQADPDLPIKPQYGLQWGLVQRATPSPKQVQLLKRHQRRKAHRRTPQILRALPPMLTLWRNSPSPQIRIRLLKVSLLGEEQSIRRPTAHRLDTLFYAKGRQKWMSSKH